MNHGIDIVLARMDSHPEEFEVPPNRYNMTYPRSSKWEWLTDAVCARVEQQSARKAVYSKGELGRVITMPWLSDEEVELIYTKFVEIQRGAFNKQVMHTLLQPPEETCEDEVDIVRYLGSQTNA